MMSERPYLIRAMHEWMSDNSLTPHIIVDTTVKGVVVPKQHIFVDDKIIMNISYQATQNLDLSTDPISFETRFQGISQYIDVPSSAIIKIYARETGRGMAFTDEGPTPQDPDKPPKRPTLKAV